MSARGWEPGPTPASALARASSGPSPVSVGLFVVGGYGEGGADSGRGQKEDAICALLPSSPGRSARARRRRQPTKKSCAGTPNETNRTSDSQLTRITKIKPPPQRPVKHRPGNGQRQQRQHPKPATEQHRTTPARQKISAPLRPTHSTPHPARPPK